MYIRATCLFIQEGYGHIQWNEDRPPRKEHPKDKREGHLIVENGVIVGAAAFWKIITNNSSWCWDFAYIDPEHQRKGYVSKRFPLWRERYGYFTIPQPWSESSRRLLSKFGITAPRNNQEDFKVFEKELVCAGLVRNNFYPPSKETNYKWGLGVDYRNLSNSNHPAITKYLELWPVPEGQDRSEVIFNLQSVGLLPVIKAA